VSPALPAGWSKCPLWYRNRGEDASAWVNSQGTLSKASATKEPQARGANAPGAHTCGLNSTAELLLIDGGDLLNPAFPAVIDLRVPIFACCWSDTHKMHGPPTVTAGGSNAEARGPHQLLGRQHDPLQLSVWRRLTCFSCHFGPGPRM
jgi:hypothetical protein